MGLPPASKAYEGSQSPIEPSCGIGIDQQHSKMSGNGKIVPKSNGTDPTAAEDLKNVHKQSLEEDDEFEDFPVDTWPIDETLRSTTNGQTNLWQEDWDDVEVEDDFTKELRAELERNKEQQQQR
ncbi:hypothetical protein HG537_0E00920 [Torulaspora globosa]|uniref:26S proteasome complex subunit SEM1 n=1 Tax=Torulaspora globosa TaxID=48254 RepID=A0A7H9HTW9_9SACH|nr:hypothetical protein HG537_0E00920 [Torulaspora sp. CBS 2947]